MFKVNSRMCKTCILGNNSVFDKDWQDNQKRLWAEGNTHQVCHDRYPDTQVACRGHYEWARQNNDPYPLKDVIALVYGGDVASNMRTEQIMLLCQVHGWIEFDEKEKYDG